MNLMMRILCPLLLVAASLHAEDRSPAALMPAETFAYVEADGAALAEGLPALDVVRLLANPKYEAFFRPAFDKMGLAGEKPVETMLAQLPIRDWLKGSVAVGLSGLTIRLVDGEGKAEELVISPDKPIDANLFYRLAGASLAWEMSRKRGVVEIRPEFMMVLDPGPQLIATAQQMLAGDGANIMRDAVQMGERSFTRLRISERIDGPFRLELELYADMSGDRWIFATSPDSLVKALEGGPRASLHDAPRQKAVRARMTGGRAALFAFVDMAGAARMAEGFLPPIGKQMLVDSGIASIEGMGMGLSLTEGGVRESFGIVLDGAPKGVWRLLDAFPGGMHSLEISPPDALMVVGAKFDLKIALERTEELIKTFLPGNEGVIRTLIAEGMKGAPVTFEKDVLPAFGDEVGLMLFRPTGLGLPIPGWVFGLEVRDAEAAQRLLDLSKKLIEGESGGAVRFAPLELEGGIPAFQVLAPIPMPPSVFALHKGHLFGASSRELLTAVFTTWGGEDAQSLVKHGEVFQAVLKGMNNGESTNLAALAYTDLRNLVPIALTFGLQMVPPGFVDLAHTPDFQEFGNHLSGVALGMRCDGRGITFDSFSPVGFFLPATAVVIVEERRQQARFAVEVRRWEEQQAINQQAERDDAAFMGVNFSGIDDGVVFGAIIEGTPAESAGLKEGDRLVRMGDRAILETFDVRRVIVGMNPGDTVKLALIRDNAEIEVELRLGRRGDFVGSEAGPNR